MNDRKPKLFILTGSKVEFEHYHRLCRENFDAVYLYDTNHIHGYRDEYFICLGNWQRKNNIYYILDTLRAAGFKELYASDISPEFLADHEQDTRRRMEYEEVMKEYGNEKISKVVIYEFITEEEMNL